MTDLDCMQAGLINMMEKLNVKLDRNFTSQDQKLTEIQTQMGGNQNHLEDSLREVFATKTTSQRAAINHQFLEQNQRVATMEKSLNDMFVQFQAIQQDDEPLLGMLDYENVQDSYAKYRSKTCPTTGFYPEY